MDYRELLKKYAMHVEAEEGVNFISKADLKHTISDIKFTDEEIEELIKIAKETS